MMPGSRELVPDTSRQARNVFRGYIYQAYQTICAWLKCLPGEEILTEFAEDVDLVRRDLDGNVTDAELNQIKHEKGAITLNSKPPVDLINNFFRHQERNPDIKIFVHLCTISDRGKEKGIDWQYAECGMDLWDRLRNRELNRGLGVRSTLFTGVIDKKVGPLLIKQIDPGGEHGRDCSHVANQNRKGKRSGTKSHD